MPKLLIATNNPGKYREFQQVLDSCGWELVAPRDAGVRIEVEESGQTYAENARIKATALARASGLVTLADDSGIEVDALGGGPGVRSARYGRPGLSDEDRVRLLLKELEGVPDERRGARFHCVIAIARPDGEVQYSEGVVEGRIAHAPRGERGFGYDPVFVLPDRGLTAAELPEDEKNRISHRGRAAAQAKELLKAMLHGT